MLPGEDSIWVGEEMTRRFGLPYWQFALWQPMPTAHAPPRPPPDQAAKVMIHNWCYHGSVDEPSPSRERKVVTRTNNSDPRSAPR